MNGLNGKPTEYPENALVPYPVILAASKGDPNAMKIVLQHFSGYIASLSMRKLYETRKCLFWSRRGYSRTATSKTDESYLFISTVIVKALGANTPGAFIYYITMILYNISLP